MTQRALAREVAWAAHQLRPLSVAAFSSAELGLDLFPRQAAFLGTCLPEPKAPTDPIFSPSVREAVALWGKGGSKDTCAAVAQLYVVYRLMLHPNPQAWLGLAAAAPNIDLVNVAYNADQARLVFFEYVKSMLHRSNFFTTLLPRLGFDPRADVMDRLIRFPHHVYAHSLHSQAEAAEGKNTLFAVMDEADAFTDASKQRNADRIHATLLSSMASRFPNAHLLMILSWPRYADSFTMRRYAARGTQGVHGDRGATWDIRADRKREDFASDYARDPEQAKAMYETQPPAAEDAFLTLQEKVRAAFRAHPLVHWAPSTASIRGEAYRVVDLIRLEPGPEGVAYWVHCDAGLTGDSYALAMARAQGRERIVEGLIEWKPSPGNPVFFPDVERVIHALRATYRIVGASFDRWNSAESIQRLRAAGLYADAMTFSQPEQLAMYQALKAGLYADEVALPSEGPASAGLMEELLHLQLLRGVKVDHPPGGSKDLADAVAAACHRAHDAPIARLDKTAVEPGTALPPTMRELGVGGFKDELLRPAW